MVHSAPATGPANVLLVEADDAVADVVTREIGDGFVVAHRSRDLDDAVHTARRAHPELVLLGRVLAPTTREPVETPRAAAALRGASSAGLVVMCAPLGASAFSRVEAAQPDACLYTPFTGAQLRATAATVLQRHRAQAMVLRRERFFSTVLTSIGDAVIATDAALRVTFINPRGEELLGRASSAAVGLPLDEVYRVLDAETRLPDRGPLEKAVSRRAPAAGLSPRILAAPGGSEVPIEDSAAPIMDARGEMLGVVVVFRDVAEQKSLEKRLAITERLVSLGTLAAGIAHEINNPMSYVVTNLGFSHRALENLEAQVRRALGDTPVPEEVLRTLGQVQAALRESLEGADRVRRIVADVKTFSRPEADATRHLNVHDTLETALKLAAHHLPRGSVVRREYEPVPMVQANESRLGQLFLNLLVNAAESAAPGASTPLEVRIRTRPLPGACVLVEVTDNGVGIPQDTLGRVFDPFFTTKPGGGGTGLGLPICHRIVMDLSGDIMVDSKPGRGTTLRVILPGIEDSVATPPADPPGARGGDALP